MTQMGSNMSDDQATLSRREVVPVGTAMLAGSALMAVGSQAAVTIPPGLTPGEQHRHAESALTQYPKPPFKEQHQDPPGLAGKMEPRPDHGETSYKGLGQTRRTQSADHWRRFRYRTCGGHCVCPRRGGCGVRLSAGRTTGRG